VAAPGDAAHVGHRRCPVAVGVEGVPCCAGWTSRADRDGWNRAAVVDCLGIVTSDSGSNHIRRSRDE
jgi:hypothetical protein